MLEHVDVLMLSNILYKAASKLDYCTASKVLPVILIGLSAEHTNRVVAETAYRINNHRKDDTLKNRYGNFLCGKYKIKKI